MRARTRELEQELNATLRELDAKSKEAVQAIEDRAAREKAAAEAERRSARLRREFSEQFTAQVRQRKPNAMQSAAAQVAAHQRDPAFSRHRRYCQAADRSKRPRHPRARREHT